MNGYVVEKQKSAAKYRQEFELKWEESRKKQKIEDEKILKLSVKYDITDEAYEELISQAIPAAEVQQRIDKIIYYKENHPEKDILLSDFIVMSLDEIEKNMLEITSVSRRVCFGDCSSCKREVCLMDEK